MENKPKIVFDDNYIVKALLQLKIINICLKLTPQNDRFAEISELDLPTWGRSCLCVKFKLQTKICRRLEATKFCMEFLNKSLPVSFVCDQSVQTVSEVVPSAAESETASVGKQTETDDEIKTTESKAVTIKKDIDERIKTNDIYDQFLEKHISAFGCAWSKSPILDLMFVRENNICDVIRYGNYSDQVEIVPSVQKEGTHIDCKRITTVDWKSNENISELQSHLAIGTYEGYVQVWKTDGIVIKYSKTLVQHKGPILALKWNKMGNYILSAGFDSTAVVWDSSSGQVIQEFKFHSKPILDVDWNTKRSFASCGVDGNIYVCRVGSNQPVKTFQGHTDSVHTIKWNPQGQLLVSCSEDKTMKLWSTRQNTYVHDFQGHSSNINTVIWSPTGPGSKNPDKKTVLASASSDCTIRLWDIKSGTCATILREHTGPVMCLDFSPDGRLLISGGSDESIYVWSMLLQQVVCTFEELSKITEVHWHPRKRMIAAMAFDGSLFFLEA